VRTLPRRRYIALILLAALAAACAAPEPQSPFAGAWSGAERYQSRSATARSCSSLRQPADCARPGNLRRRFRFGYARRSRDALIALAPEQPDLRSRLTLLLVRPDYPVAELGCGDGGTPTCCSTTAI